MKLTERELRKRIEQARDDLLRKRNYLKSVQKDLEEAEILLEYYEGELKKLKMNPSSRLMSA